MDQDKQKRLEEEERELEQEQEQEQEQEEEERKRRADIKEVNAFIRSKVTEGEGWAIAWALTRVADEIADAATYIGNRIEESGGEAD
jgi:hypothetical protein